MDTRWLVEEDKKGFVHVRSHQKKGNFKTKEEAIEMARKIAKGNKTILRIHAEKSGYETVDYTSILTPSEIVGKTLSEVKLARAERTVSKIELERRKQELRASNQFDKDINRHKYALAKERYKKAKMNLKNAILKNKKAVSSNKEY